MNVKGTDGKQTPSRLIDALMTHWACWDDHETFYLTKLAPMLIANPESGDATEVHILGELRPQLRDHEWTNLPQIIADRRAGILHEFEGEALARRAKEMAKQQQERERAEAAARAEQERARAAAEAARERIRQAHIKEEVDARKTKLLEAIDQQFDRDWPSPASVDTRLS